MKRAILSLGAALALTLPWAFLGVPTASAVPVTSWSYTAGAGFSAFAPAGVTGSLPGSLGTPTRLEWGISTGPGPSALEIDEPTVGVVLTGGPSVPDITITHENRPIAGGSITLTTATITGSLTLTPLLPVPGAPVLLPPLPFSIAFAETVNAACTFPSVSVCDDIFVLTSPAFPVTFPFSSGGDAYLITLTVTGLGALPAATCTAAGVGPGCVGLTTPEGADSTVPVRLAITAVPEPSTILLLGSGLAALTLCARKKVSKKVKETA